MPVAVPLLPPPPPPIPVGSGRDIFIFRPAEPLPSGNVYNSWPALVAAAATVLGPKIVYFDNTLAACSIPPGTWDFASPTAFVGTGTLLSRVITPTPLAIPDGVKLPNVFTFSDLDVTSFTTTSVIDVPAPPPATILNYVFSGATKITQAGPGAFIRNSLPVPSGAVLLDTAQWISGTVFDVAHAAAIFGVGTELAAIVNSDTITGIGGTYLAIRASAESRISTTQTGIPGGVLTVTLAEEANGIKYDDFLVAPPLGASDVQGAIDALKGTIATGTPYEYVFQPGGVASGNVYDTWANLVAAAAAFPGKKLVYFDSSFAPCSIPAGAWDFASSTIFKGANKQGPGTPLAIADGATLVNAHEFADLAIDSQTTTFVINAPSSPFGHNVVYRFSGWTTIKQTGGHGGTFLQSVTSGLGLGTVCEFYDDTKVLTSAAGNAFTVASPGGISFYTYDRAEIQRDTVAAPGAGVVGYIVSPSTSIATAHAGIVPGGLLPVQLLSEAVKVSYDDALVSPPLLGASDVQGAIDKLKSSPIESWKFSGTFTGSNNPSIFYAGDVPDNVYLNPVSYPRSSPSNNLNFWLNVPADTLVSTTTFTVYLNGAPTTATIAVPGGGPFTGSISAAVAVAQDDQIDLRLDCPGALGDVGNSLRFSASVDFLP